MREILFRGKTKHGGEWVYGGVCCSAGNTIIVSFSERILTTIEGKRVLPETVGQYTGLTDKNGKKIFEGDILEFSDRFVVVFWHTHLGCWGCNFLKFTNKENGRDDMSPHSWGYRSEVIGNIHDNPELLKGE